MNSLLACVSGVSRLVVTGEELPDFDIHCPLLSLPLAFRTELNTIPSSIPYIFSNRDRVRQWQTILGERTVPRIGLVWSGRPEHHNDRNRSIPLAQLATLVSGKAQFISLQKEVRAVDKKTLDELKSVLHFGNELRDFADTAALVQLMDVVISVDTSVAHLAGAMGKPVWILLPFIPDWRWLLDRDDSPWYPTAKLFRQPVAGDWSSVIAKIKNELAGFLG
jgi:ADP-heptose:LPS heptosyltransferase